MNFTEIVFILSLKKISAQSATQKYQKDNNEYIRQYENEKIENQHNQREI